MGRYYRNIFLQADERELLTDAGDITAQIAKEHVESEFEKFRMIQDRLFESDFDRQFRLFEQQAAKTEDNGNDE